MQEADDIQYAEYPESIRVITQLGAHPLAEFLGVSDHPDADVPGIETFVRYVRADETDVMGFVPEHWQEDAMALRRLLIARQAQFLAAMAELQECLDYNARSTRDRLQRVRRVVEKHRTAWEARSELFGKEMLDDAEDMV